MTDVEYRTTIVAGRAILVREPTGGQYEAMARIARTIDRGADDSKAEFWMTQVDRLGTLMESLIAEGDRVTVDQLVLTGKLNSTELLKALLEPWADAPKTNGTVAAAKKASASRVQRK